MTFCVGAHHAFRSGTVDSWCEPLHFVVERWPQDALRNRSYAGGVRWCA